MLWISTDPIVTADFPPCIKNMIQKVKAAKKGRYRRAAILASFLGQSGWKNEEAKSLWLDAVAVEERIFTEWFGKMHCPKCVTMQQQSRGYPDLGIADLGLCQPDEKCRGFVGPVEYAADLVAEKDWCRGSRMQIRTIYQARVFDWTTGKVGEIELSLAEKNELEGLQKEQTEDEMLIYSSGNLLYSLMITVTDLPDLHFRGIRRREPRLLQTDIFRPVHHLDKPEAVPLQPA